MSARLKNTVLVTVLTSAFGLPPATATAANSQTIYVQPGKNTDVYLEVNVSGKVYLSIHAASGARACANFWWIKWPFGSITDLGRHCDNATFDIPGIFNLALWAKLRVGGAEQPLAIVAAANEQVAQSVTVKIP